MVKFRDADALLSRLQETYEPNANDDESNATADVQPDFTEAINSFRDGNDVSSDKDPRDGNDVSSDEDKVQVFDDEAFWSDPLWPPSTTRRKSPQGRRR